MSMNIRSMDPWSVGGGPTAAGCLIEASIHNFNQRAARPEVKCVDAVAAMHRHQYVHGSQQIDGMVERAGDVEGAVVVGAGGGSAAASITAAAAAKVAADAGDTPTVRQPERGARVREGVSVGDVATMPRGAKREEDTQVALAGGCTRLV